MINRVLIRIKVVQLLYSYLLTENQFMLESQPSAPTKEKRFAYGLYLDMLVMVCRIADSIEKRGGYRPLADTRFVKKLLADEKIKTLLNKYRVEPFPMEPLVEPLAETIKESGLYKNFIKDQGAGKIDDQIWEKIFTLLVYPSPLLTPILQKRTNYTVNGVERMKKTLEETFANFYASRDNIEEARRILENSMQKSRDLYMRLLDLPVALVRLRAHQLDENRNKYLPTDEDLNPNMRFVDNQLVKYLEDNTQLQDYFEKRAGWMPDHQNMLESLLKKIIDSEVYQEYMAALSTDAVTDCEFWRNLFKQVIFNDPDFLADLESESVFWNDDLEIIGTFVLKTFKKFEEQGENAEILPMFKDHEDAVFGSHLLTDVVNNKDRYRSLIDDSIDSRHWDMERLAFMDVVIAMTALAEIINFPKIPLAVSVNEYVEIAKSYSTGKSGSFIHGLLGSISQRLREEGVIAKS